MIAARADAHAPEWRRYAALLVAIVRRDLVVRYRRSVLGVLWAQASPLALLGVLTFVFTRVAPIDTEHYAAQLFVGLLLWTWLQSALSASADSVVAGGDLIRQPRFPAAMLPLAATTSAFVQLVLALPVLAVTVVVSTGSVPHTAVAFPAVLAVEFALLLAPALAVAAANVRYRDVGHLTGVVLLLAFYATPVVYPIEAVPERYRGALELNPMTHVLAAARDCVLLGRWPDGGTLLVLFVAGVGAGTVALGAFGRASHRFVEEL